ncbi:MAG: PEP-CTERM sorting domain-containing protein, partial [Chthoniobacteraceae bacterium]
SNRRDIRLLRESAAPVPKEFADNLPSLTTTPWGRWREVHSQYTSLNNYFVFTLQSGTTTGQFDFLSDGTNTMAITYLDGIGTVTLDNILFDISYTGDFGANSTMGGQDVVLTPYSAVPEPETWTIFALGALALFLFQRRKNAWKPGGTGA